MESILIVARPIVKDNPAYILLQKDNKFTKYFLIKDEPFCIEKVDNTRYCNGWYDITTHNNHPCEHNQKVDGKYSCCFSCRQKTAFNPAFYNTNEISDVQAKYNKQEHSVYISYFANGMAKAGIMSDSRGIDRIYEQGALLYVVLASFDTAEQAHHLEAKLINKGLKNSITKKQKETTLSRIIDVDYEKDVFRSIIYNLNLDMELEINSNLDHFFYGKYIAEAVTPLSDQLVSGHVVAVVGRYLITRNNNRLFGFWLDKLNGYKVNITKKIETIDIEPMQVSLF